MSLHPIPKSPVPKQRKSLSNKASKAERLKSRLAAAKCPPPSKERLNELILKSNTSASLNSANSSSSGVSSSRSSELQRAKTPNKIVQDQPAQDDCDQPASRNSGLPPQARQTGQHQLSGTNDDQRTTIENGYKLCQCSDCQTSGQAIYSLRYHGPAGGDNLQPPLASRPLGTATMRKAVSFRPSVEHIGSPSYRLLNDALEHGANFANWPQQQASRANDDTCDSLHATKDFSSIQMAPGLANGERYDDDYLRPLDCSTPKTSASLPGERLLVQAEVHQQPRAPADYTCLCSPDFMCVHNYPSIRQQQQDQQPVQRDDSNQNVAASTISNAIYGNSTRSDFTLSRDCIECRNLSTYVNLSRSQHQRHQQGVSNDATELSGTSSNGYESGEYKRLIRSKQCDVYGNLAASHTNQQPRANETPASSQQDQRLPLNALTGDDMLDEQMHYLSAARRLQQTLDDCAICSEHLLRSNSLLECNCPIGNKQQPTESAVQQQQQISKSSDLSNNVNSFNSKSFHTASSSLPSSQVSFHNDNSANSSKLSVLPLTNATNLAISQTQLAANQSAHSLDLTAVSQLQLNAQDYHQPKPLASSGLESSKSLSNLQYGNNLDSSLSSLFVYRHVSDDNAPELDEFDPDSLEISAKGQQSSGRQSGSLLGQQQQPKRQLQRLKQQQDQQQQQASWLKPRPTSDYISLSSTTSSLSTALAPHNGNGRSSLRQPGSSNGAPSGQQQAQASSSKPSSASKKFVQVDSDLTQSSLAKRRQLSNQLQQQQSSKKKLSRSSPNVAKSVAVSSSGASGQARLASSSNGNNVKSIYQCVKNHLLDITSSSKSSSSQSKSSSSQHLNQTGANSSASLPRNLSSTKSSRSNKLAQVCMRVQFLVYPYRQ